MTFLLFTTNKIILNYTAKVVEATSDKGTTVGKEFMHYVKWQGNFRAKFMRSNPFALWLYIWWFLRRAKVFQWDGSGNSDRHGWTPVDFDWLSRIPSESIEQYFCLLWCSSDFRYSFASWLPVISLPLEGVRNRILPIQLKKKSFPSESLGVYWTYMTVFVYFPHRMLQTQDWDSVAFSTTCLQCMATAVNVSHELSLKSSQ